MGFWIYIGSHGDKDLENYDIILPSTTYLEKESAYMNLTGLIQKSNATGKALPKTEYESDILNMFLIYLDKWKKDRYLKKGISNLRTKIAKKILNNQNSVYDIQISIFHTETVWENNLNKNSTDIDKYFTSNRFSKSSKIMNTIEMMNEKSSYFSKN